MTDNWRNELRLKLEDLVDKLVVDGVSHDDACRAVIDDAATLRTAREHHPNPADDVEIEEPANDWPAAS